MLGVELDPPKFEHCAGVLDVPTTSLSPFDHDRRLDTGITFIAL
jgi:hypothetical protein